MKINIQKGKHLCLSFLCFLSCACLLMAAVPAAMAVSVPARYYVFDEFVKFPSEGAASYLAAGVPFAGLTYEQSFSFNVMSVVETLGGGWQLRFDDVGVASFSEGLAGGEALWLQRDYQYLYIPNNVDIPSSVLDWLKENGTFSGEPPLIQIPSFDFEDIFPDDLILGEYTNFANIVGIFIRNNITAPFVLTLFGLVLISFILYGKK